MKYHIRHNSRAKVGSHLPQTGPVRPAGGRKRKKERPVVLTDAQRKFLLNGLENQSREQDGMKPLEAIVDVPALFRKTHSPRRACVEICVSMIDIVKNSPRELVLSVAMVEGGGNLLIAGFNFETGELSMIDTVKPRDSSKIPDDQPKAIASPPSPVEVTAMRRLDEFLINFCKARSIPFPSSFSLPGNSPGK